MEILQNLSMFWSLFHVEVLFLLLFQRRYSLRVTLAFSISIPTVLVVLNLFLIALTDFDTFMDLALFTCTLPTLILGFLLSKYRDGRFFFTFCVADTTSFWIMQLTNFLDRLSGDTYVVLFVSRIVCFLVLEFVIWFYLRRPYLELQAETNKGWWLFTLIAAIYYLLIITMSVPLGTTLPSTEEIIKLLLVLALMPTTYLTILWALYRQILLFRAQEADRILAAQKEQLESQLENQHTIRELHHNMKAFCNTLSGLLAEDKLEDARAFLSETGDFNGQIRKDHYCTDTYLNAVLVQFSSRFSTAGARLNIDVKIGTEPHSTELCLILSNALDNALEAVSVLPEEEREASVQILRKGVYLLMRIKNRCDNKFTVEKGTYPHTSKPNPGHGYGLTTICRTAESLGGNATCYTENGFFILDVMIRQTDIKLSATERFT
ncbi:MAG: GHKL domain-containing protein [Eubacteriales bacterium]|nr:GHKL domain-containing protein [Eubacteriales bacterium]